MAIKNRSGRSGGRAAVFILSLGLLEGFIIGFVVTFNPLKRALFSVEAHKYLSYGMFRLIALLFRRPFLNWLAITVAVALATLVVGLTVFFVSDLSRRMKKKTTKGSSSSLLHAGWLKAVAFGSLFFLLIINAVIFFAGTRSSPEHPNAILIIVDALRPDHMSCYGYGKNTTPNIDRLAEEAALFSEAVVVFPRTTPSAVSILTGLYPHTHGTRSLYVSGDSYESPGNLNLAEVLLNENYRTAAFLNQNLLHRDSGLRQGFNRYENLIDDLEVTRRAVSWLKKNGGGERPFFLLLWYLSPHWPYNPSRRDRVLFTDQPDERLKELFLRGMDPNQRCFAPIYDQEEIELLISAYDAEIHQSDRAVGVLLDYLRQAGLYRDSLIVITSDHGESLGEHGYFFDHGEYYYDTDARVPLLIKKPGRDKAEKLDFQVRNIDIFPTVLRMLNLSSDCEGVNLFPETAAGEEAILNLIAFGENDYSLFTANPRRHVEGIAGKWRMARTKRWKLLFIPHPRAPVYEFYDLKNDPGENENLIDDPAYQTRIKELKKKLFSWIKAEDLEKTDSPAVGDIHPATRARLKSLGYL